MSASIVSKEQIDAMVQLALTGPADHGPRYPGDGWNGPYWSRTEDGDYGYHAHGETGDALGLMLWSENVESIHYRYPDTLESGEYPGPADFTLEDVAAYSFPIYPGSAPRLTAIQGLKALDGYEYQSCEHPGWGTSEAKRFCEALRHCLIHALPGYDEADWEVNIGSRG